MKGSKKAWSWRAFFVFWFVQISFVQPLGAMASVPSDALQHRKDTESLNRNSEQSDKDSTYVKHIMLQKKHKNMKLLSDLHGLA